MKPHLRLPLHKAVVGQAVGELPVHVVTYIAEIERLQVAVSHCMEEHKDSRHLAVGHEAWTVATAFAGGVQRVFFQFRDKIFAELIENTENSIKFASAMGMDIFM